MSVERFFKYFGDHSPARKFAPQTRNLEPHPQNFEQRGPGDGSGTIFQASAAALHKVEIVCLHLCQYGNVQLCRPCQNVHHLFYMTKQLPVELI